jgi:16S rRNA (cytosine967-C5)-methyltransferase
LSLFEAVKIQDYTALQKSIVTNIISSLSPKGYLLYSTCSVFKAENEDIAAFIAAANPTLKLVEEKYLIGYTDKADTMYAALFQKLG